ncbi:MAG: glucose-6-phosphate isomerase, partial [Pseudonocardiaceae bacterium]
VLPVVLEHPGAPGSQGEDVLSATIGGAVSLGSTQRPGAGVSPDLTVNGPLGAQFLIWEYATAVAGILLKIDPFDQPNVAESKQNTAQILQHGDQSAQEPFARTEHLELYGDPALFDGIRSANSAVASLIGAAGKRSYLAVMAYLDRIHDAAAGELRGLIARRAERPVTFGWGPRFLHSTGQYHKGGPANGAFLQITGVVAEDLAIPGKEYSFKQLQAAQAAGDRAALIDRGLPLLRVHLLDRKRGIDELLEALR